jgi:hypothetical protein
MGQIHDAGRPQDFQGHPHAPIAEPSLAERRAAPRLPVIKSAKIMLGPGYDQGAYNCLVLDQSACGVLVDMGMVVKLPEELTVQFQGGGTYLARRRWSVGSKTGLEFIGGQVVTGEVALRMARIADVLNKQGVVPTVATLRAARFFDNAELRRVAEQAESAMFRLEAMLNGREAI